MAGIHNALCLQDYIYAYTLAASTSCRCCVKKPESCIGHICIAYLTSH